MHAVSSPTSLLQVVWGNSSFHYAVDCFLPVTKRHLQTHTQHTEMLHQHDHGYNGECKWPACHMADSEDISTWGTQRHKEEARQTPYKITGGKWSGFQPCQDLLANRKQSSVQACSSHKHESTLQCERHVQHDCRTSNPPQLTKTKKGYAS